MRRAFARIPGALMLLLVVASVTLAETKAVIPSGACIYIEKMDNGLDGYVRAEMIGKKVPLKIVLRREQAHYVMTGAAQERKGSWHEGWLSPDKDHATGSVMVIDRFTNEMVWASEAGDRSLWWGALARGGPRKVASRLVDHLKEALAAPRDLPSPPPLSPEERTLANQLGSGGAVEDNAATNRMTNEDVMKLVGAGVSDDVIIARIKSSQTAFATDTDALVALKKAGVSDRVLTAMLETPAKKASAPA
jgi:hypothetical protein